MSKYTDVTNPVIIRATQGVTATLDNWLRRMAIVSMGDSNVPIGSYKTVGALNWSEVVLTESSDLHRNLASFFSQAGSSKEVVVIEVGASNTTREAQVNHLKGIIEAGQVKFFNVLVPSEWLNVIAPSTNYVFVVSSTILVPTEAAQTVGVVKSSSFEGDTFIAEGIPEEMNFSTTTWTYSLKSGRTLSNSATVTLKSQKLDTVVGQLVFNKEGENSSSEIDFSQSVAGQREESFLSFAISKSGLDEDIFFFSEVDSTIDVSTDENIALFKNLKALHLVSDSSSNKTVSSVASVMGITANSIFDINSNSPATSLNYKNVKSFTPKNLTQIQKSSFIDFPLTFIDELAGLNVILNGRQLDGTPWDYYYYFCLAKFRVQKKITQLLINGTNNPVSAISFDQDGIDTVQSNIQTELQTMVGEKILTTFAKSYDSGTGSFIGEGSINFPNYYEFIKTNPEDYKNERLTGLSCYLQIGRFVRQVQWDVSIGG